MDPTLLVGAGERFYYNWILWVHFWGEDSPPQSSGDLSAPINMVL